MARETNGVIVGQVRRAPSGNRYRVIEIGRYDVAFALETDGEFIRVGESENVWVGEMEFVMPIKRFETFEVSPDPSTKEEQ